MLNEVKLIGRLGGDPELRYTQGGQPVANFNMATSEKYKDKSGTAQEKTEWHKIVIWGAQAETCEKYLKKGALVCVLGKIQTRDWEDKDGNKRYTTEINAQRVLFLESKGSGSDGGGGRGSDPESNFDQSFEDSEIPF